MLSLAAIDWHRAWVIVTPFAVSQSALLEIEESAIATIIVLYVVKIGLNTFCEYTEPETDPKLPAAEEEKGP